MEGCVISYNPDEAMRLIELVSKTPPGPWHIELGGFIYARQKIADAGFAATTDERTNNAYAIAAIPDLAAQLAAAVAEIDRLTTELQERNTNEL